MATSAAQGDGADAIVPGQADPGEIGAGIIALQDWLCELQRTNLARLDEQGVLHIDAAVARRFALAFVTDVVLLAMPPMETVWARIVPWDYAAIYRERTQLYLVGETMELDGAPVPPLAVSFTIPSATKAAQVMRHDTLELRGFSGNLTGAWQVSPRPFAKIPIHVLDETDNVMDLFARKPRTLARAGRSGHG